MTKISSLGICMDDERSRIHKTKKKFTRQNSVKCLQNSRLIYVERCFKFGTGVQEKS